MQPSSVKMKGLLVKRRSREETESKGRTTGECGRSSGIKNQGFSNVTKMYFQVGAVNANCTNVTEGTDVSRFPESAGMYPCAMTMQSFAIHACKVHVNDVVIC